MRTFKELYEFLQLYYHEHYILSWLKEPWTGK